MGSCMSGSSPESKLIDAKMLQEKTKDKITHKLLLVGTGNAGKTTFFRQFQMLSGYEFTSSERKAGYLHIANQIVASMITVGLKYKNRVTAGHDKGHGPSAAGLLKKIDTLCALHEEERQQISLCTLDATSAQLIQDIWSYEEIKWEFAHLDQVPIPDSCAFFWDDLDRITSDKYTPSNKDLIMSRVPTGGANNFEFSRHDMSFMLVDVGGQQCERKKWMNYFDNVTGLLYVVSLSAWDEVLYENKCKNAMEDQIEQFEHTANLPVFANTPVILFMNKKDLLEQKLKDGRSIGNFPGFNDFDGGDDFDQSIAYIRRLFLGKNGNPERSVFTHATHATDTESVRVVLLNVTQTVVQSCMKTTGLL